MRRLMPSTPSVRSEKWEKVSVVSNDDAGVPIAFDVNVDIEDGELAARTSKAVLFNDKDDVEEEGLTAEDE
eukprot:1394624-Amorphochlora_amoeboformis.AAC.1